MLIATRVRPNTPSAERSHSCITHLIEFGYPERFAQDQPGHSYASTTAIYTNPRELHQTGEEAAGQQLWLNAPRYCSPVPAGKSPRSCSPCSRRSAR
jgi:hypothetical protein